MSKETLRNWSKDGFNTYCSLLKKSLISYVHLACFTLKLITIILKDDFLLRRTQ